MKRAAHYAALRERHSTRQGLHAQAVAAPGAVGAVALGQTCIDVTRKVGGVYSRFGAVSPSSAPFGEIGMISSDFDQERKMIVQATEFEALCAACGCVHRVVWSGRSELHEHPVADLLLAPRESLKMGEKGLLGVEGTLVRGIAARAHRVGAASPKYLRSSSITSARSGVRSWFQTTYFGR
jgi:hypothetical protein